MAIYMLAVLFSGNGMKLLYIELDWFTNRLGI